MFMAVQFWHSYWSYIPVEEKHDNAPYYTQTRLPTVRSVQFGGQANYQRVFEWVYWFTIILAWRGIFLSRKIPFPLIED